MGHILYLVPVWTLATAWLYLLSRLAPALDTEDAVSGKNNWWMDWNLKNNLRVKNILCMSFYMQFFSSCASYHFCGNHVCSLLKVFALVWFLLWCSLYYSTEKDLSRSQYHCAQLLTHTVSKSIKLLIKIVSVIRLTLHILYAVPIFMINWD